MADREDGNDESAEAKNPAGEPRAPRSRTAFSGVWIGITCHALGILYYGGHLAHVAWPGVLDLLTPLVQHWS